MNQSRADRRLGVWIAVLGLMGLGIAGYLAYVHYANKHIVCFTGGGCEVVQSSRYAKFAGVPVPTLGVIGYVMILLSLLVRGDIGRALGALFSVSGFGFSAYLTWLEVARIKAICQWCVASAVVMTLLAIFTTIRLLTYQPDLTIGSDEPDDPDDDVGDTEPGETGPATDG